VWLVELIFHDDLGIPNRWVVIFFRHLHQVDPQLIYLGAKIVEHCFVLDLGLNFALKVPSFVHGTIMRGYALPLSRFCQGRPVERGRSVAISVEFLLCSAHFLPEFAVGTTHSGLLNFFPK
jgi:hypothetical protein